MAEVIIVHRDDTCTYWSVLEERWKERIPFAHIDPREIMDMSASERRRLIKAMAACGVKGAR